MLCRPWFFTRPQQEAELNGAAACLQGVALRRQGSSVCVDSGVHPMQSRSQGPETRFWCKGAERLLLFPGHCPSLHLLVQRGSSLEARALLRRDPAAHRKS